MIMPTSEGSVKSAVDDALARYQAQGKLQYFRMNSGSILAENKDGTKRRVQLHKKGTWDFLVLKPFKEDLFKMPIPCVLLRRIGVLRLIWIETKGTNGKLTQEQKEFQAEQEELGAECFVVRDADEIKEIING